MVQIRCTLYVPHCPDSSREKQDLTSSRVSGGIISADKEGGERGMDRRWLFIVFQTILPLLTNPVLSDCENSEEVDSIGSSGATFNETHELSEAGGGNLEEDEEDEEDEESEDAEEAFNDLEDETMLCADYVPQTRNKRLPDAIIIGARKVNTKECYLNQK